MTSDTPPAYRYRRPPRRFVTTVIVVLVLAALLAAWLWFEAAVWLVIALALFTLPALYDIAMDPAAGLDLDADAVHWFSGRREAEVAVSEIDHIRLDTRLDFSVRASVVLRTGRKIRLPFEATPPHAEFENALNAAGIKTMRHHFQLIQ
ncbi:MAG: hypothetical protein WBB25_20855 [Sulfitobacter sp.]